MIYVRQSSPSQVRNNRESPRLQYALQASGRACGKMNAMFSRFDADLGPISGSLAGTRPGFQELEA